MVCALIAVILDGKAYGSLPRARAFVQESLITCVVSGVLMGLWNPFMTYAMTRGNSLTPYSPACFSRWALAFLFCLESLFHEASPCRRAGELWQDFSAARLWTSAGSSGWRDLGHGYSLQPHRRANSRGQAISYAIGQSAPMVAALWGVLAWKEFAGSGTRARVYLALMFVFYGLAILLVARANGYLSHDARGTASIFL